MPGKKGFGDSRKKSSDTPIYKMKGSPMQRNFKELQQDLKAVGDKIRKHVKPQDMTWKKDAKPGESRYQYNIRTKSSTKSTKAKTTKTTKTNEVKVETPKTIPKTSKTSGKGMSYEESWIRGGDALHKKWVDKGGKAAYIKAAKAWRAKNPR